MATDVINESTELTIDGLIDIGGLVPKDKELKISFNTDEYRNDNSLRGTFQFLTSSTALKTNANSLEVKEVATDGSYIIFKYTKDETTATLNLVLTGFNTPSYPSETGRLQLIYDNNVYSRRITFVF